LSALNPSTGGINLDSHAVWNSCLEQLKDRVPGQTFDTWFRPIKAISINSDGLFLQVPNKFFYDWIDNHYKDLLRDTVKAVTGNGYPIRYTVLLTENTDRASEIPPDSPLIYEPKAVSPSQTAKTGMFERGTKINENYDFDSFVEGANNQFAKAAAMAVANAPGRTAFNPLVVYGGTGLGKTHLIQAIGNEVLQSGAKKRVAYVSSDTFTLDFIAAIQNNKTTEFSRYYRSVDMLLLDDVQFFQKKEQTQEQFFHIFNDLYQHHKQIVFSSDQQPLELKGLHDRLLSRFQSGLIVDIQPPDLETRIAILHKKATQDNLELPYEVIEYLATNIRNNIRELEGAMIRLLAYSSLLKVDIDLNLTRKVLKEILGSSHPSTISIEIIQNIIGSSYRVNLDTLVGKGRTKEVAEARMVAMYFAREHTNLSLKTIGLYFGGRDHSTVVHAGKWVENRLESDSAFSGQVSAIRQKIENSV